MAVTNDESVVEYSIGQNYVSKVKRLRYNLDKHPPISIIIGAAFQGPYSRNVFSATTMVSRRWERRLTIDAAQKNISRTVFQFIVTIDTDRHVLLCLPACLAMPFIVADGVCAEYDSPIRTKLFSSTLLMCGISTIIETTIGIRLPILRGPATVFLPVILAVQKTGEWECSGTQTANMTSTNTSHQESVILSQNERLRQLSGSIMAASLVEITIGGTGLVGLLLRFVGPITVAPVIALTGISLYKIPIRYSRASWELALVGAVFVLISSLYLNRMKVPLPTPANCKLRTGRKKRGIKLCQLLPVLLSILVVWGISAILTVTDVFPYDPDHPRFRARADAKSRLIDLAPWFYVPYPGQFGMPSFSVGVFIGLIAVFFTSLIKSVGDYYAAAKACEVASPPNHAVNRGIFLEGLGGLLCGAVGVGYATTCFSANIAAMKLTRTANRYILICSGVVLILFSVIGKFGAVLATIPDPALGGALAVIYGMLVSLGLSTLQFVNLNSPRNLLILGVAFFTGIFVPEWIDRNPDFINTGSKEADNILKVVLGTQMFLGGFIAIVLDNTARGSRAERGIDAWQKSHQDTTDTGSERSTPTYGWFCQSAMYRIVPCCSKLPFMPPQQEQSKSCELPTV